MTFSVEVKKEICSLEGSRLEYISELSSILRNAGIILENVSIVIENIVVAKRIYRLFRDLYGIKLKVTIRKRSNINRSYSYILEINDKKENILTDLSIMDKGIFLNIPKKFIYSDDDVKRAYLRGLFMVCGSINDPKKSRYHLEFIVDDMEYAEFICMLLNSYDFNSRVIKREKNYMVYIKEADKISDFLRLIKAYKGVMYFEDVRIYREEKNMTNRLNNCEQANMDKVFMTASKQIQDIKKLEEHGMMDMLDDKIKEVIKYRLENPESSLQELSEIMSKDLGKPITKSGLNHRFRKIKDMVKLIEDK